MKAFGVGDVLGSSFRVWKRNLVPFSLLALLIYAPDLALRAAITDPDASLAMIPFGILLNTILAASLTYGVVMELHGTRPSFGTCIRTGIAQLLPVLGVVFVSTLGIAGGLVLLVVPGILLMLSWYVVVPVAIVEHSNVMDSLRRSRELTAGYRTQLFAVFIITTVPVGFLPYVTGATAGSLEFVIVSAVLNALAGSFMAVVTAVAYTKLRQVKDGTQILDIASAFARFKA